MIPRIVQNLVVKAQRRFPGKAILLFGARQTGKTTLLKSLEKDLSAKGERIFYLNCDFAEDKEQIDTNSITLLKKRLAGANAVFIDEAQRLQNAGLTLKIIVDNFPNLLLVATGSSAFELKNSLSDAMTGRYYDFTLYPLALREVITRDLEAGYLLDDFLRFGAYPAVYLSQKTKDKIITLEKIIESYLFKDVFEFGKIRNSEKIKDLCKLLAYQIGNEVNENELSNTLGLDRKTIGSYLNLLEQAFIIFRLKPFSSNLRQEIGRKFKIYFLDLGIRNALIGNFNELKTRPDVGALWENWLVMERMKKHSFAEKLIEPFFWRTYGGAEIDYLEKSKIDEKMSAFEFKWRKGNLSRGASRFREIYKTGVKLINKENFTEFVL